MTQCLIDGYDFWNMEAMKYFSPSTSWSADKKKENAKNKIFSEEWLGAQKRDGAFYMFIKDMEGNMYLRPRSRNVKKEFVNKIDWVPHLHSFFDEIDNGTVFLGEIYLPRDEQAKTTTSFMNCLLNKAIKKQKKEEDKLHYYIFDILAEHGESLLDEAAERRFNRLGAFARAYSSPYVDWAEYVDGKELWELLQNLLAAGYEGVVITNKKATYNPGKRSNKVSLKIKKELQDTIDCIVIGAEPPSKEYSGWETETWNYWFDAINNERITAQEYLNLKHVPIYTDYVEGAPLYPVTKNWFYGWAGSWRLGAYKDGKIVQIGRLSGLTDEMRENWKNYVGRVVEVSCMEIMDNEQGGKGLRHPKLLSIREDVEPKECTWERIFG